MFSLVDGGKGLRRNEIFCFFPPPSYIWLRSSIMVGFFLRLRWALVSLGGAPQDRVLAGFLSVLAVTGDSNLASPLYLGPPAPFF